MFFDTAVGGRTRVSKCKPACVAILVLSAWSHERCLWSLLAVPGHCWCSLVALLIMSYSNWNSNLGFLQMGGCSMEHLSNCKCVNLVEKKKKGNFFFPPRIFLTKLLEFSHVCMPAIPQHLRGSNGFVLNEFQRLLDVTKLTSSHRRWQQAQDAAEPAIISMLFVSPVNVCLLHLIPVLITCPYSILHDHPSRWPLVLLVLCSEG